eukprot:10801525-Heterocapsa_arctica.AAC.1
MSPNDVLIHLPSRTLDRADAPSLIAISSCNSLESGVNWPFDLVCPTSDVHLRACFSGKAST